MFGKNKSKSNKESITLYCVAYNNWEKEMKEYFESTSPSKEKNKAPFLPPSPLTFVTNENEAGLYCDRYLYLKYYDHYHSWCVLHQQEPEDYEVWLNYLETCVVDMEEGTPLNVYKMNCTADQIATVLRIACSTVPAGMPWETNEEVEYLSSYENGNNERQRIIAGLLKARGEESQDTSPVRQA